MSRVATDWAWTLNVRPASLKLMLLSMADRADEEHCCFPSIARLVRDTSLDKKTIQKGLCDLQALGVISDTGERKGATKRVKVWQLSLKSNLLRNEPKNGNIPENGHVNDPENGTLNDPENGIQNQSFNQSSNHTSPTGGAVQFTSTAAQRRMGLSGQQGFPMPPRFAPSEKHARIAQERQLDLTAEFEKFTDFCVSTGRMYLDWGAALSLWLRNSRSGGQKQSAGGRGNDINFDNTDWAEDLKL